MRDGEKDGEHYYFVDEARFLALAEDGATTAVLGSGLVRPYPEENAALFDRIAETGHLTFGTLHTNSAPQTINRIVDVFPEHQQAQIRAQLSFVLEGIICQSLLPRSSGKGRALACEVLIPNSAIRNLIREDKVAQMYSAIQTGGSVGMQTLDQALETLVQRGLINKLEAARRAVDKRMFN